MTSTNTPITPEILRTVADEADSAAPVGGNQIQFALRRWADHLEREQADEKRIDECVDAYQRAYNATPSFDAATCRRAGVRAVLAAYDPEGRLVVPVDVAATEAIAAPPRTWDTLAAIPADVHAVRDKDGDLTRRDNESGSGWSVAREDESWFSSYDGYGPFVEVTEPTKPPEVSAAQVKIAPEELPILSGQLQEWPNLESIPLEVTAVYRQGIRFERIPGGDWRDEHGNEWHSGSGPFVEAPF